MGGEIDWRGAIPGLAALPDEPMSRRTTFRVGGPARWILQPADAQQAGAALRLCREAGIAPFFLGNGSNLLVRDEGYDGVMLSTAAMDQMAVLPGEPALYAHSGALLPRLANLAAEAGLSGLEFASGIPGSVGGAARMNAGAYGGEMSQVVERVDYLDEAGRPHALAGADCGFAYRHSVFCQKPWFITGALFRLKPRDPAEIRAEMAEMTRRRREKQPLDYPSAGSTFKRPQGHFAAALIESCGLKGLTVGGAQVSEKHSGFLINLGGATCADVLALMERVRDVVWAQTGVRLEPEVEIIP